MSDKKRRVSIININRLQGGQNYDIWDNAPVWITKSNDPVIWEKGIVISRISPIGDNLEWNFNILLNDTNENINISTISIDKQNLEYLLVKRRDNSLQGHLIDDMTSLLYMNEPELLECVRQRYYKKSIYTSIGPILLAMNPFERLPIYDDETLISYSTEGISHRLTQSPHVFHVANRAYNSMFVDKFRPEERENQAILVNGESGAGKTESTKHVLHFLAVISSKVASQIEVSAGTNTEIENQILASNPILESFGNAKTTRNNNSSRFGKFIELLYTTDGYLEGAVMRTYLLETMRVAFQGTNERNYHVFYQIHAGLDSSLRQEYGLTDLSNYHYTNQSGELNRHDGESDLDNFAEMKDAFSTLGVDDDLQNEVDRVIISILHIGNLSFTDSSKAGEDAAEFTQNPTNNSTVNHICNLLSISKEVLLTSVARRSVTVVGNTIEKTLNSEFARYAKDSLARFLYSSLFTWVVSKINSCLTGKVIPEQSASFIGVLDIFGFEHFAKNSFEQLCINYTNEKLQDHFNYSVFKSEQEIYKQEGLKWTFIAYPDNSERLELLEHNTNGILSVCNEQLKLPKSTDEKLASALYQKCGSHPHFRATRQEMGRYEFTILHYACPVTYQSEGFLDKNRTENPKELYELLLNSTSPLLLDMIPPDHRIEQAVTPKSNAGGVGGARGNLAKGPSVRGNFARAPSQRFSKLARPTLNDATNETHQKNRLNRATIGKKVTSLSSLFQSQLTELITKIRSTRSHFICCVKPNKLMQSSNFDIKMCTDQLRCSGSLGAIQVFKAGFSNRLSFSAFTTRFSAFAFVAGNNSLTNDFKSALIRARSTGHSDHWRSAAGRLLDIVPLSHMVLALIRKESPDCDVDFTRDMQMGFTQIFLKASAFEFLEKLQLHTRNLSARRLQLRWRAWRVSRIEQKIKTRSGKIRAQEAMRYFSDFRRILAIKTVSATLILQRRARVYLAVKYRKWMIKQFINIQRRIRYFLKKRRLEKLRNRSARLLQQTFRSFVVRQHYLRYRKSVITLQSRFRGKYAVKLFHIRKNAAKRGLWAIIRLQSIHRANHARAEFYEMKRIVIKKRFEDQLHREKQKSEMLSLLQAKLEENPDLLNYIQGNTVPPPPPPPAAVAASTSTATSITASPKKVSVKTLSGENQANTQEVQELREVIEELKEKVKKLEAENTLLQNRIVNSSSMMTSTGGSVEEWKLKVEKLEKENFELRKSLLVKRKSESGHSTSRSNLFTTVDEEEDVQSTPITPKNSDPRDLIRRRLSLAQDSNSTANINENMSTVGNDDEQSDWVKKYSDQHKRFYWRNKINGTTSWTPPTDMKSTIGMTTPAAITNSGHMSVSIQKSSALNSGVGAGVAGGDQEGSDINPADLRIATERLTTGWIAMKLSSSNYPKERLIVVDRPSQVLSWKKGTNINAKIDGSLNLDTIKRITRGRKSRTLEKVKGIDANLCLSVHYLNTSLDLQLSSETERNLMYFGLKELTKIN